LNRLKDELQRARFAFDTAKDESLPRWPLESETTAKNQRIESAKAQVQKLQKQFAEAGESVRQITQKLVDAANELRNLEEQRAKADCFAKGEAFIDPQTHLPELPPA
jgi:septal ring factor EnvC (AmiA/AmiB activator)